MLSRWLCPAILSPPSLKVSPSLVSVSFYQTLNFGQSDEQKWFFIVSMCFAWIICLLSICISSFEELPVHLSVAHLGISWFYLLNCMSCGYASLVSNI